MHSVDNPYTERQWIVQDVDQWAESQLHHCTQGSRQVCHQLVQEEVGAEMEELDDAEVAPRGGRSLDLA